MTEERLVRLVLRQWRTKRTPGIISVSKLSGDEERMRMRLLEIMENPGLLQAEITRFRAFDPAKGFDRWQKQQTPAKTRGLLRSMLGWCAVAALLLVFGGGMFLGLRHSRRGAHETISREIVYDTLIAPPAQQRHTMLPDGTGVWLNYASSLRYPQHFDGRTRIVELTGEAYFEVATDTDKPFLVRTQRQETEVLGTRFDVKAYADDPMISITVEEGKVRVSSVLDTVIVRAGEQMRMDTAGRSQGVTKVDTTKVISWKKGFLDFTRTTLEDVMRQVARRYDVEVSFIGPPGEKKWTGKLALNVPLDKLLEFFEENHIHCRLQGRQLFVQVI